ncbi:hypothetical protein GDO78_012881, partial [Eleutherodactylus coqui]
VNKDLGKNLKVYFCNKRKKNYDKKTNKKHHKYTVLIIYTQAPGRSCRNVMKFPLWDFNADVIDYNI